MGLIELRYSESKKLNGSHIPTAFQAVNLTFRKRHHDQHIKGSTECTFGKKRFTQKGGNPNAYERPK